MCAVPVEPSRESRSLARSRQIFVSTMYVGLFVYLLAFEARELHTDSLSQHGRCVPGLGGWRLPVPRVHGVSPSRVSLSSRVGSRARDAAHSRHPACSQFSSVIRLPVLFTPRLPPRP